MMNSERLGKIINFLNEYKKADYKSIKKRMRYYRKQRGITPDFFEKNDLITVGQVKMMEKLSYKHKPSLESLVKYCYGLGIELEDLLSESIDLNSVECDE